MQSYREPGLHLASLCLPAHEEYFLTAIPLEGESTAALFERVAAVLAGLGARVLCQQTFGLGAAGDAPRLVQGEPPWPLTRVLTAAPAGTQLWAARGLEVHPVIHGDRVVGSSWSDGCARYLRLGDLGPASPTEERGRQAQRVLELMEELLHAAAMDFNCVARTWFYFDRILEWYGEFNRVRNDFFTSRGLFDGLVPASTGIGGANPSGAALVAGLIAVQPLGGGATLEGVPSPLQCPARDYGSTFSRALEVRTPQLRRLYVSGTASIAAGSLEIQHVGDLDAQIERTLEVIGAILSSRGLDWTDTTRALAYFKDPAEVASFESRRRRLGLPELPVVALQSDVCFDELLFELELDAIGRTAADPA